MAERAPHDSRIQKNRLEKRVLTKGKWMLSNKKKGWLDGETTCLKATAEAEVVSHKDVQELLSVCQAESKRPCTLRKDVWQRKLQRGIAHAASDNALSVQKSSQGEARILTNNQRTATNAVLNMASKHVSPKPESTNPSKVANPTRKKSLPSGNWFTGPVVAESETSLTRKYHSTEVSKSNLSRLPAEDKDLSPLKVSESRSAPFAAFLNVMGIGALLTCVITIILIRVLGL